jgi:hypothetical protein
MSVVYGKGIQNYMQDSPVDVGIAGNPGNAVTPVVGKPLPILGTLIFLDHTWNDKFTSSVGYSSQDNDNTDGQKPDAFRAGYYALGNLLYTPVPNVLVGGEFQWGRRENFSDGWKYDDYKIQFVFKYSFSHTLGG